MKEKNEVSKNFNTVIK